MSGSAVFKRLLADMTDYFDCAPRGAALKTLQKFGVCTGTPFPSYFRHLLVDVAHIEGKGVPLAPSSDMAIELVRIRTAQQYPLLMPTLFPDNLATRERSCSMLASTWTALAELKHNTMPMVNCHAFTSTFQASSPHAPVQ